MPKTVYLAGAGPGDERLITVKALDLIKKADCIVYDYLVNPNLLRFAKKKCELIYVGKKAKAHTLTQEKINELLVRKAKKHDMVLRLKGGDPYIFGRGAEEALHLKKNKINVEVVPGITSAIAVPAYAGISLTHRTANSTVGFITGHEDPTKDISSIDWDALSKALGTMVFLMGVGNLPNITKKLIASGKSKKTPVALVRWGTTAKQEAVTGTLGSIVQIAKKNGIKPPAIIVVGEVVKLRKTLNWFEEKPLFGKRIVVTRTRVQASGLSEKFIELGAEVVEVPTIEVVSLKADKKVKAAFKRSEYDWIFFTSQNGVKDFSDMLDRIGKDSRIFGRSKVCAIGSETAKSLAKIGIKPDYVPGEFRAEAIIDHFKKKRMAGKNVLILRAKQARNVLPDGLKKLKALVKVVDLYDTRTPKESDGRLKDIFNDKVDMVTFTSSSTVKNFVKLAGKNYKKMVKGVKIASIGPITSKAIKEAELSVDVRAKVYTIKGLVEAIVKKIK